MAQIIESDIKSFRAGFGGTGRLSMPPFQIDRAWS